MGKQNPLFIILFFFLLNMLPQAASSQEQGFIQKILKGPLDTNYIRDYKDQFTGRFYLLNEAIGFRINPPGGAPNINYRPNIFNRIGVAGFYKWFGMGISVKNPLFVRDSDKKGMSSIIDLRVNAYGKSLAAELSLQDYQGFYLGDSEEVIPGWDKASAFYHRPDMKIRAIGAFLYYIFNSDRHSIRAAYLQNEQQLKSSGGFIIMPSFLYTMVKADSGLIPEEYLPAYSLNEEFRFTKGNFLKLGLSAGYSYTFVFFRNFYINASLIPGGFYQPYDYSGAAGKKKENQFAFQWLARFAVGYNSRSFYAGAGGVYAYNESPFDFGSVPFNFDMNQVRLWVGKHFKLKDSN